MKHIKKFESLNEAMDWLKDMPELTRDQQEDLAQTIRGLVYAYEHRDEDMSHIPGHPGSEAFLSAKMNQAKATMKELNIPEAK
jgi:hypothetical protein